MDAPADEDGLLRGFLRYARVRDLRILTPIGVVEAYARYQRLRARGEHVLPEAEPFDPVFSRWLGRAVLRTAGRYFRMRVEGLEHVPANGPALIVANHNGAGLPMDSLLTFAALVERLGAARAPRFLVHDLVASDPVISRYASRMGALRASPDAAGRALDAGHLVVVYPGSDLDAYRPFRARHRIRLGGRRGFARLALAAGVPIVPLVSVGTHEQLVVLDDGRWLARWVGADRRFRLKALPISLCLPWGLAVGPFPYLPLPAQTTLAFGPPIGPSRPGAPEADRARVDALYARTERAMQDRMSRLARGRRPLLGTPPRSVVTPPADPPRPRRRRTVEGGGSPRPRGRG
ncbi:MAG: lysophospholipid acyltransferase family protein [Sandaracinaceae bacterium]